MSFILPGAVIRFVYFKSLLHYLSSYLLIFCISCLCVYTTQKMQAHNLLKLLSPFSLMYAILSGFLPDRVYLFCLCNVFLTGQINRMLFCSIPPRKHTSPHLSRTAIRTKEISSLCMYSR